MLLRVLALLVLIASPAAAQWIDHPDPTDPVSGAPEATYLDLLREIVPDLEGSGYEVAGSTMVPVRHIGGDAYEMQPPATPRLAMLSAIALDGTRRLLLADFGPPEGEVAGFAVLALFDMGREPRLVDAVNVGFDQVTLFVAPAVRPLGGGELVITHSVHSNSSQTYVTTALTLLREGRFEPVDDVFTFSDAHCSFDRRQQLSVSIGGAAAGMADIAATVAELTVARAEPCGGQEVPEPPFRMMTVTWRWDAAAGRYMPDSDAFEQLAAENEKRF